MEEVAVKHSPQRQRFELFDGQEPVGFLDYDRRGDLLALTHAEVDPRREGQGLGGLLVRGALDAVRAEGFGVLPFCSFVRMWISRHPEYVDLVPESERARFRLPPGTAAERA